jgi:molybdenum cofactor cytidylyltransferase
MRTFALIPAAGQSRRMGQPKLALPLGDRTVLECVVAAVLSGGVAEVWVVVGPGTAFLQPLAEQSGARVHVLPEETPDMRATVLAGLARIEVQFHPSDNDAWFLLPADHPTLQPRVVNALLAAAVQHPTHSIVLPTFAGKRGHPTLFRWKHVAGIRELPADRGLNAYIRAHADHVFELPWPSGEVLMDLDTPSDYEQLVKAHAADGL